jgi:hypothetical protein
VGGAPPGPAPWAFTGTTALVSDGEAGSYAESATNAAARLFYTAANQLGAATFLAWVRVAWPDDGIHRALASWGLTSGNPRGTVRVSASPSLVNNQVDNAGGTQSATKGSITSFFDGVVWTLVAATVERTTADVSSITYNDVAFTSTSDVLPDAHTAGEVFRIGARNYGATRIEAENCPGAWRQPAVLGRVITAAEVAALYAAGPTHDIREAVGDYTGPGETYGWWPGDGETGTTVTDRGTLGCNLTLHGGVTIEAV